MGPPRNTQIAVTAVSIVALSITALLTPTAAADTSQVSWTRSTSMPTAAVGAAAVSVEDTLYVLGGYKPGSGILRTVQAYDTETGTWETKSSMPFARAYPAAARVADKILVFGGFPLRCGYGQVFYPCGASSTVQVYDTTSDSWTSSQDRPITPMPTKRGGARAATIDGLVYVMGGACFWPDGRDGSCSRPDNTYDVMEVFDPVDSSWRSGSPIPQPLAYFGIAVTRTGLYLVGGAYSAAMTSFMHESPQDVATDVYRFDARNEVWDEWGTLSKGRAYHDVAVVGSSAYVIGGMEREPGPGYYELNSRVLEIPLSGGKFQEVTPLPTPRSSPAVTVDQNQNLHVLGGSRDDWNDVTTRHEVMKVAENEPSPPTTSEAETSNPDSNEAAHDIDDDGVSDSEDACPQAAGPSGNDGCPTEPQEYDADGDGIPNQEDNCPGAPDTDDADSDGVPDACDPTPNGPTQTEMPQANQSDTPALNPSIILTVLLAAAALRRRR